jgi:hypothetical protein
MVILSAVGLLYRSKHEEFVGGEEDVDPQDSGEVAATIFIAVLVYAVRLPLSSPSPSSGSFVYVTIC